MRRRLAVGIVVLLALVGAAATCSRASSTTFSPCTALRTEAVASPDGTQIAYYGTRWPRPASHGNPNSILQAFCVANANGKNAQPLRYTVCSEKCPDFPYQITWVSTNELLYVADGPVLSITPGSKPKKTGISVNAPSFALDAAGDRLASGANFPGCVTCAGPVTVFDVSTGALVGDVGGKKLDNLDPSLSPDGSRVVLDRQPANDSGKTLGIWTANADGTGLRQLETKGFQPLWSPVGNKIAYITSETSSSGLRLVGAQGGKAKTLVRQGVSAVVGWSPDGKHFAFEAGSGKLDVVDVATTKVRQVLQVTFATVTWAPDSKTLLAVKVAQGSKCSTLWRAHANGSKATLLRHC